MFDPFVYLLRDYGIPATLDQLLQLNQGIASGVATNIDDLFIFSRLVFVKRVEHLDAFQRAFALYFFDLDIPNVAEGDPELFQTKQFKEWLAKAIKRGDVPQSYWNLSRDELMKMFWERVREQMKEHHGGNKWIGTGGSSPFGHSGVKNSGVRVYGESKNRSAIKIIGERKYVEYAETNTLTGDNIRQAVSSLKNLKPSGAFNQLSIDETIRQTAKNGGEIELVFSREKMDKIEVALLIDNGGSSMLPHVELTRLLFSKLKDRFKELNTYFFHNTIYGRLYTDSRRQKPFPIKKLLEKNEELRVIIVGDASMAPEELHYGSIYFGAEESEPSTVWLKRIKEKFKKSVWLNPIPREQWPDTYGAYTLHQIRKIFQMEDLTIKGIKNAVEYLNLKH